MKHIKKVSKVAATTTGRRKKKSLRIETIDQVKRAKQLVRKKRQQNES